jgi:hypothetical protein
VRRIHRPWALRPTIRVSVLDPKFLLLAPSLQLVTEFDPYTVIIFSSIIYVNVQRNDPEVIIGEQLVY